MDEKNYLDLQYRFFLIDDKPYCLWDKNINEKTLDFLDSIEPNYYEYFSDAIVSSASEDNIHYASLALRTMYSQALETFFAILCASIQAPRCIPGWIILYRNNDLRNVVKKIHNGIPLISQLKVERLTWELCSEIILSSIVLDDKEKEADIKLSFGRLWSRFASDFLDNGFISEYNSIKHGLRVSAGGFELAFGIQDEPGIPPKNMQLIGKSKFGTGFHVLERFENSRHHIRLKQQHRNWHPQDFAFGLKLVSMSIANVVSTLKIVNGISPESVKFHWPDDFDIFDEPWKRSSGLGVTSMSGFNSIIHEEFIEPFSKDVILEKYKSGDNAGIRRIRFTSPQQNSKNGS